MNREERGPDREGGVLDTTEFLKVANKFIELANRENQTVNAPDLHMAFLYGAARYNAYVAKAILDVNDREEFVDHMVEQYRTMLLRHLEDETLERPMQ